MNSTFDINSPENAWLGITSEDMEGSKNPLLGLSTEESDNIHLHILSLMKNPDYFHWTTKVMLNVDLLPIQTAILKELWIRSFPMYTASRGFGKSFLLAVYCLIRCLLIPETKIVIVGAAFRQSKVIFEYMDTIWRNAPLLQSVCSDNSGPRRDVDRCTMRINDGWAMAVPLGDGTKIRGLRAHTIIADEFNSIPTHIYETVVAGFAAVSSNPTQNVKEAAARKKLQKEGLWEERFEVAYKEKRANQSIIAGTAGYEFEPYASYWKKYKSTIQNRGDFKKVAEESGEDPDDVPEYMKRLDWRNFSVIRIPYELIPEGFMDDQQVARARATMHNGIYQMEYGACFTSDSQGFFKRSLIHSCVSNDANCEQARWPSWSPTPFDTITAGSSGMSYVMGIDPASEQDNFAIVIVELRPEHQRVVYTWSTNKKDFQGRKKIGLTDSHDYYSFCARKIRDLAKAFPCVRIGIDSQGGGYTIAESLRDLDKLREGERPIYEIIEEDKAKETDDLAGDHILHLINFASAIWTSQANHGMRKDLEDKVLLFPRFDTLTLSLMTEKDKIFFNEMKQKTGETDALRLYDTLEDGVMEIEELKDELSGIVMTVTPAGRERWNTPEIKLDTGKKGRLRKDRYSALVIANMIARTIHRQLPVPTYQSIGRIAGKSAPRGQDENMYVGPEWAKEFNQNTCFVIKKDNQ
tara:strand:- start:6514 stop:8592 length:2079 start_codon:yes stop_codon:yes gene_type:complete